MYISSVVTKLKCRQDSQNIWTKLLSPLEKIDFWSLAKIKFAHSHMLHPQSDHIINTLTKQM